MPYRASRLIDEIHRAFDGTPWHGPSLMHLLREVSAADAEARPVPSVHSIGEITAHLLAWTAEVARRLEGFPPGTPPEGDWPPSRAATAAGWATMQLGLTAAVAHLQEVIAGFPESRWDQKIIDPHETDTAAVVTYEQTVHGLAQHFAYHGGQVAILKKALAETGSS
jgi:uncharacterized damage-inducible protein DinB